MSLINFEQTTHDQSTMQFIHRGLLASILLVAPLSYGAAQQEKFDNNFIAKDLFIIPQKQCSDQRMQEHHSIITYIYQAKL